MDDDAFVQGAGLRFFARSDVAVSSQMELGAGSRLWKMPEEPSTGLTARSCLAPAEWRTTSSGGDDTGISTYLDDDLAFGPSLFDEIQSVLR